MSLAMNTKIIMKLNSNKVIVSSLNQIKHLSRQKRICQPRAFAVIGFLLLMAFSGSLFAQTLIGHWTFANQTLANTGTTGATNDGAYYVQGTASTPVFSANIPPGMSGYSLDLTAAGAFMAVSNSGSSDSQYNGAFDNGSFTVALWEKRPNSAWQYDAWNVFADKTDGGSVGFFLRRQGVGNNPFADVYPTDPGISSSQNINDGSWHHLAITYSAGVLTLYVDGVATVTGSGTFTPDTAAKLIFGAQDNTGYRSSGALLSDLRFYNYALTASQVFALLPPPTPALIGHWTFADQTLANSGTTGSTNDGICYVSGTASAPVFSTNVPPGMSGNSLDLTTQGSFMAVSNSASGDASYVRAFDYPAFTVALWENRPNSAWQYDAWNVFADKTDGASAGFYLRRQGVGNNPFADVYPTDPGISSSQNINDGSWHHLAITYSAGVLTLYVDGVTAGTGSGTFTPDAAAKLIFGAQDNSGYRSSGALLSDLRFYNYALTASQVSELTLAPGLPTVSNPNSLEIYQGLNATFSAVALGNPEPTVQWYRNGNPISGATSPTLTITNVGIAQQASYTIVAANSFGSVTSSPAILTIINPPGNGTYASAILAQNPMGYWRFSDGGGTNAYDYVGGNNAYDTNYMNNGNGSTGNPATLGAGPQPPTFPGFETTNTAPFLDGLSQGYSSSVGLFNNRSNFTIMGWFNLDPSQYPIAADPFIHPDGRASLFGQEWASEIGIYQGTNLYFYATGISATIFANTNLVPGVWNFVAAVSDATANTTTLYLNGAVVGTALACPGTVNPYLFSIGKNVAYFPSGGYDNAFFPGSLDEVAAFDHPLSLSQIQALYQTAVALANVPPTNVVAKVASISGTNNLILTGAGGSGSSYTVLTTTNLTTPLANWSTNATGLPFGAGGSVNYTNPINPATPKLFYRIRVP